MTGQLTFDDCKVLGKPTQKKVQHEAIEQTALFQWAKLQENIYPELRLLYAVPNGGTRNLLEAVNLKRQGLKAGVPDVVLPVPRKEYHGLYLEMKRIGGGKASEEQMFWLGELAKQGYHTGLYHGWKEAVDVIQWYLGITNTFQL